MTYARYYGPEVEIPQEAKKGFSVSVFKRGLKPAPSLLVLIHGLNGDAYKTWLNWANFARESPTIPFDLATVGYDSGLRRLRRRASKLDDVVTLLAEELRELPYSDIVLAGHSLGGIIARRTVLRIHGNSADADRIISKVSGIILLASPGAGSVYAFAPLSNDLKYLGPNSPSIAEMNHFFTEFVDMNEDSSPSSGKRYHIPIFSGIATLDSVVGDDSSANRVSSHQQQHFDRTHSSLVKANEENDPVFQWTVGVVARLLSSERENKRARSNRPETGQAYMLYDFNDYAMRTATAATLRDVVLTLQSESAIRLRRRRLEDPLDQVSLIMRLLDDDDRIQSQVYEELLSLSENQPQNSVLAIGRFGPRAGQVLANVKEVIPIGRDRYIEAISSLEELAEQYESWLILAVEKLPSYDNMGRGLGIIEVSGSSRYGLAKQEYFGGS